MRTDVAAMTVIATGAAAAAAATAAATAPAPAAVAVAAAAAAAAASAAPGKTTAEPATVDTRTNGNAEAGMTAGIADEACAEPSLSQGLSS